MNNTTVQGRQTRARPALRSILLTGGIVFGLSVTAASATGSNDWLQFGYDASHSGNNTGETVLNQQDVGRLHLRWRASLVNVADGSPAFKSAVYVNGSYRDMVFVTTRDGFIEGLDAASGAVLWSHQNGPGSCRINNGSTPCYTTSSPAIFTNSPYVYSYGLDGRVHKYQQGDGTEVNSGGWPETMRGDFGRMACDRAGAEHAREHIEVQGIKDRCIRATTASSTTPDSRRSSDTRYLPI